MPVGPPIVALGELLAPIAILTCIQWCLVILTAGLCSQISSNTAILLSTRLSIGLGAAMMLPVLNLISLGVTAKLFQAT